MAVHITAPSDLTKGTIYLYFNHCCNLLLVTKTYYLFIQNILLIVLFAEMASWLAANGPISIGINAEAMISYTGGISYPNKLFCLPFILNHGVLIVGYGIGKNHFSITLSSFYSNLV